MANGTRTTAQSGSTIPPDDANNKLTLANPEDPKMRHISVAGGTYTILVTGEETGDRYCLIVVEQGCPTNWLARRTRADGTHLVQIVSGLPRFRRDVFTTVRVAELLRARPGEVR